MTPVAVITGFLGSGKTTLIARLLRDPALARTAVIVNEFGEIGLDHDLIATGDETLLQLTTGCLCCAIRTDLVQTLLDLHGRRLQGDIGFDRVLIETSGLADPAPILHALMTDPALAEQFSISALTTLVDTQLGVQTLDRHPEARRQVSFADRILFTKTDLAPAPAELVAGVMALNPHAVFASGAPAEFFGASTYVPETASPLAEHSVGIGTAFIRRQFPVPAVALTLLIEALAEHCGGKLLRLKGLVDVAESPGRPAVIHGVQHVFAPIDFLPAWPSADHTTRIVLIGQSIPGHFPARLLDAIITEVTDEQSLTGKPETPPWNSSI